MKSALLALLLLLCSLTGQLSSLLVVSLLIGMAATMAQDIVPAAAILAPAGKQGKMVGTVMTGLLLGSCSPGRSAAWWAPYSAGG